MCRSEEATRDAATQTMADHEPLENVTEASTIDDGRTVGLWNSSGAGPRGQLIMQSDMRWADIAD